MMEVSCLIWVCLSGFLVSLAGGLDNGLARTPPMGWMSWGRYRCNTDCDSAPTECISEDLFLRMSAEFISGGYADAGYQYIIIDDCWMEKTRDQQGRLQEDHRRFPSGIKALAQHIHALGLKFGIYENYGSTTCEKYPGSKGYEEEDTQLFAEYEADYVKLDGCFTYNQELNYGFPKFGRLLNKTGRPMVFSCSWPYYQEHIFKVQPDYPEIQKHCNLWRNYHDISSSWDSIKTTIDYYGRHHERMASYAGPGHWNDPDMLMIGNPGLTAGQCRIQMSVWSILAAPLIMSNDLPHISPSSRDILLNREVIAVDQDPLGLQGSMLQDIYGDIKIWRRQLIPVRAERFSYGVVFVNMNGEERRTLNLDITELGMDSPDGYTIVDLYTFEELRNITKKETLTVTVAPHDVVFYKFNVL